MLNRLYFTIAEVGDLKGDLRYSVYDRSVMDWEFWPLKNYFCGIPRCGCGQIFASIGAP